MCMCMCECVSATRAGTISPTIFNTDRKITQLLTNSSDSEGQNHTTQSIRLRKFTSSSACKKVLRSSLCWSSWCEATRLTNISNAWRLISMNSALKRNFSAIEKLMLVTIKLQMLHKQSYCNMSHLKSKPMTISTKPKIEATSAKTVT